MCQPQTRPRSNQIANWNFFILEIDAENHGQLWNTVKLGDILLYWYYDPFNLFFNVRITAAAFENVNDWNALILGSEYRDNKENHHIQAYQNLWYKLI